MKIVFDICKKIILNVKITRKELGVKGHEFQENTFNVSGFFISNI